MAADAATELYYRDDWLGEPWRTPEAVMLIHGVYESSIAWQGAGRVLAAMELEPVVPRIIAPTLVVTSDRSPLQSVDAVMRYQRKIPDSRLLVLASDAYHVAVVKADECVTGVMAFIEEMRARQPTAAR